MSTSIKNQDPAGAGRRYCETMALAEYSAALMTDSDRDLTTDDLYDENGLPK